MPVPAELRELVRSRAGDRCEYCHTHQDEDPLFTFHVEHIIIARQHDGPTVESNLALSCHHCNLHKVPTSRGLIPKPTCKPSCSIRARWDEHFAMRGPEVIGLTPVGRTTVRVLAMNARGRLDLRSAARSSS
jgi:hypothetical protein